MRLDPDVVLEVVGYANVINEGLAMLAPAGRYLEMGTFYAVRRSSAILGVWLEKICDSRRSDPQGNESAAVDRVPSRNLERNDSPGRRSQSSTERGSIVQISKCDPPRNYAMV